MKWYCTLLLAVCATLYVSLVSAQTRPQAKSGLLDARGWNFEQERLPLSGYWVFYSKLLLSNPAPDDDRGSDIMVPSLWNDNRADGSGKGFGTYYLRVLLPHGMDNLAFEIPQLYNSYVLIVNGKRVTTTGEVGTTKDDSKPHWIYKTASFTPEGKDTLDIVLQLSNFHHFKGGIREQIYLGKSECIDSHYASVRNTNLIEASMLGVLALVFVTFFFIKRKKVALYFGLFCLTWAVRSVFSNLYLVVDWFPSMGWTTLVRTEYLTLYFGMIWSTVFLYYLFKNSGSNRIMTYILIVFNAMFVVFTLLASPAIFSKWVSLYLVVAAITVVYGGVMVVRALFVEYAGAWFLMASILVGVLMFGYDIIMYQTTFAYNYIFLNIGYMLMFLLIALGLLFNLEVLKSKPNGNVLRYEDMFSDKK